jgi:hypothetical protein
MLKNVLFIFLALTPIFLSAQEGTEITQFKAGLKAGVTTSQMEGDGYAGFNKINPQAGFFLQKQLNDISQLQFELIYIQKGSKDPGDPDNGIFNTYRIQLDYIEVPLLYQREWRKFLFEIGPGLGVLFNTKEENSFGKVAKSGFNWRYWEIDAMLGVNYYFTERAFVNIRIHQSLVSIVSTVAVTPYGTFGGAFNSVIGTSFNWTF